MYNHPTSDGRCEFDSLASFLTDTNRTVVVVVVVVVAAATREV
jgi:hypothetical protein